MKSASHKRPQKSGFAFAGYTADFERTPMASVRIMGKPVALFRREDGTYFAREMACKHQGADLTKSPMAGGRVTCARHGWQYDLETGECLGRDAPPLRAHDLAVEGDAVFVALFPIS